jgi:hypothetical protein
LLNKPAVRCPPRFAGAFDLFAFCFGCRGPHLIGVRALRRGLFRVPGIFALRVAHRALHDALDGVSRVLVMRAHGARGHGCARSA